MWIGLLDVALKPAISEVSLQNRLARASSFVNWLRFYALTLSSARVLAVFSTNELWLQKEAGWLGCLGVLTGCVAAIIIGRYSKHLTHDVITYTIDIDLWTEPMYVAQSFVHFRLADVLLGKMKLIAMLLLCVSVFALYWFILVSENYIKFSMCKFLHHFYFCLFSDVWCYFTYRYASVSYS